MKQRKVWVYKFRATFLQGPNDEKIPNASHTSPLPVPLCESGKSSFPGPSPWQIERARSTGSRKSAAWGEVEGDMSQQQPQWK